MRKPTSQKEKRLKGDSSKRKETKDLVQVDSMEPAMPPFMVSNKIAVAEWHRLIPVLAKAKMLTPLDGVALGMLCVTYAMVELSAAKIAKDGPTFRSPNGHICQRPEVAILEKATKQYLKLCQEFGLTPKARSSLRIPTGGGNSGAIGETRGKTQSEIDFEEYFGAERSALAR